MRYLSTRARPAAAADSSNRTFSEILLAGLAPDGGLYLPASYPRIDQSELAQWRDLSYADLACAVLARFIDDIPLDDLRILINRTYTPAIYGNGRNASAASEITPLRWLEPPAPGRGEGGLAILELSNGPTLAFKDMAMQLLGNLFEYVLTRNGEEIPHQRMSPFQRAQMYSLQDPNIYNIAVRGTFDDAQDIVKAVSNDHAFKTRYRIGAVNSINWARVAAQVIYYFKGYFAATREIGGSGGQQVAFAVPSGNFGNICAGHIARMMGLPIGRLVLATNENDVLDEFFRSGIYRPRATSETAATSSPSMDISKASNFERFVFDLVGRDPDLIRRLWSKVDAGGSFDLSSLPCFARLPDFGFVSGRSTHADRLATIRRTHDYYGLVIDPHTADGLKVGSEQRTADMPMVVLETALPAKFEETIVEALGHRPDRPAGMEGIETLPQRVEVMDASVGQVQRFIAQHVR